MSSMLSRHAEPLARRSHTHALSLTRCPPLAAASASSSPSPRRHFHSSSPRLVVPKPMPYERYRPPHLYPLTDLEKLVKRFVPPTHAYNQLIFGPPGEPPTNPANNTALAMRMLRAEIKHAGPQAKNVIISPVTLARSLAAGGDKGKSVLQSLSLPKDALQQALSTDYDQLVAALTAAGDVALHIEQAKEAAAAKESFEQNIKLQQAEREGMKTPDLPHMIKRPFPLNEPIKQGQDSTQPAAAASVPTPLTHSLSFTAYLAPKYSSPKTRYPNYFFDWHGQKKICHVMAKMSQMWYIESETFQMIDLPYLNNNFMATLVLPRASSEKSILNHPDEFNYNQVKRAASTVHDVLNQFCTPSPGGVDMFNHHLKYMQRIQGLVGIPGFQADYSVNEQSFAASSGSGVTLPHSHRSSLCVSPHGLDVGVHVPKPRPGSLPHPNFTALFDRPFLFFLRCIQPANPHILFAGVINDVFERTDWSSKYPMPAEWTNFKEEQGKTIKQLYSKVI